MTRSYNKDLRVLAIPYLETRIEATQFPAMEQIPMYPIILSVSSGDPRGRGLNVIFITEYHEAMTPLNKLQEKYVCT